MAIVIDRRGMLPVEYLQDIKNADYIARWKRASDVIHGEGGFITGYYLDKFPRETDEAYDERRKWTKYQNIVAKKLARYVGYLYKDLPVRETTNELASAVIEDCDNRGNSIDVFMMNIAKEVKMRGCGCVLVDMPKEIPQTYDEQLGERALPYLVWVPPERISYLEKDIYGNVVAAAFYEVVDDELYERYFDTMVWELRKNDEVLEAGDHGLGVCPLQFFSENGEVPTTGEFTHVADMAIEHYNLKSELRLILKSQTFSLLTLQARSPQDVELKVGVENAIVYGEGMDRPDFIAPDPRQADTYMNEITSLETRIDDAMYDINTNQQVESGIALDIKFQGLNGSLSNFATRLEDFERRLFEVVCLYLDLPSECVNINYANDFSIKDVERDIRELQSIADLGYTMPTYESEKLKQIAANSLDAEPEVMEKVFAECEDAVKTAP